MFAPIATTAARTAARAATRPRIAARQAGDALAGLQCPPDEGGAQCTWQSDTQHHGKTADLVLQGDPLADQFLRAMISDRMACAGSDFT